MRDPKVQQLIDDCQELINTGKLTNENVEILQEGIGFLGKGVRAGGATYNNMDSAYNNIRDNFLGDCNHLYQMALKKNNEKSDVDLGLAINNFENQFRSQDATITSISNSIDVLASALNNVDKTKQQSQDKTEEQLKGGEQELDKQTWKDYMMTFAVCKEIMKICEKLFPSLKEGGRERD